jgi:hypothetical protein
MTTAAEMDVAKLHFRPFYCRLAAVTYRQTFPYSIVLLHYTGCYHLEFFLNNVFDTIYV